MAIKPSLNNINNFVAPSNPANKTAGILLIVVAVIWQGDPLDVLAYGSHRPAYQHAL